MAESNSPRNKNRCIFGLKLKSTMAGYKSSRFFKKLKQTVESTDTKSGQRFDFFIEVIIILSLISFSIETIPDIDEQLLKVLHIFDVFSVIIFTIEYVLRIFVADKKLKYIFSFFGIIDLIAILPYFLMLGVDLRSIRSFRMLRLLRLIKLLRYNSAITHLRLAVKSIREELIIFFIFTIILIYLCSVGIYYFEHEAQPDVFTSIFHSMWFAVTSLTTVGYGDMVPITTGGKIFSSFMVIIGLGIVAVPAGLFASSLTKKHKIDKKTVRKDEKEINRP